MRKTSPFEQVRGFRPGRSFFDLSHTVLMTGDAGYLYPCLLMEANPADVVSLAANLVIRMMPLIAPVLHRLTACIHYFFVPYRILWSSWEDFITGGDDGTDTSTLPTWNPSAVTVGSLWDYMGFPTGVTPDADNRPLMFPVYAYNSIYNHYYRDEWLISEVSLSAENLHKRAWRKDYFSSALSNQQKGTPPALPISGTLTVDPVDADITVASENDATARTLRIDSTDDKLQAASYAGTTSDMRWVDPSLQVDISAGTTFDVTDIRLAVSIQRWLEKNARTGSRYTEHLRAHHGVAPRDDRLNRPEYIGGIRAPIIISEVLQTSSEGSTEAVGTMAGHGVTAGTQRAGTYSCKEHGLIMGLLSIMPEAMYSQGINRQWLRQTRYEFFNPEFAFLSEQAILRREIYLNNVKADNETIFGYQGQYDELRYIPSRVAGEMRFGETYDHWNIGRYFSSAPSLNQTFIECTPRKDYLAASSEPAFIIHCGNIVKAARPLPALATPGITRI